jgi:azurin
MKTCFLTLSAVLALALAGCGPKSADSSAGTAPAAAAGPREIDLTANDMMKYSQTALTAAPGEKLHVVLTNVGSQPKEVMGHDWVLLKAGSDAAAFSTAAIMHKAENYIAPELSSEVVAKIDLLGPRQTGEVTFTVPTAPGDYTFLCTFPAHYQAGMHGTLTVK